MTDFAQDAPRYRDALHELKEIILANVVMAGEIPSPTGQEQELVSFLHDRFVEASLNNVSIDEAGNGAAIIPGKTDRNILVAAHVDKIWRKNQDHTISVGENTLSGRGIADNSLGVAVLASLPDILEKLGIQLNANIVLLGTTHSFGEGDLGGIRFFLENTKKKIHAGLCLEGIELGRLSYSSLGMVRGQVDVKLNTDSDWPWHGAGAGAIGPLTKIVDSILSIERPEKPRTSILLGSVQAGSGYSVPPPVGSLRFEIRSESEVVVDRINTQIKEIVEETVAQENCEASLSVLAHRYPGDIGFQHPLVKAARDIMGALSIKPRIAPSISELSALLDRGIPALTLGITHGHNHSMPEESIEIGGIYSGVAQIVSTLQFIDQSFQQNES